MSDDGDALFLFCSVRENFVFDDVKDVKDVICSGYYINQDTTRLMAVRVFIDNYSIQSDTTQYILAKDTIENITDHRIYIVKDGRIVAQESKRRSGLLYGFGYNAHDQIVCESHLDGMMEMKYPLSAEYSWKKSALCSGKSYLVGRKVSFKVNYNQSPQQSERWGGLEIFLDEVTNDHWELPFAVLGFYGQIPDEDLCECVISDNKTGEIVMRKKYKNVFDKNGMIKSTESTDDQVAIIRTYVFFQANEKGVIESKDVKW